MSLSESTNVVWLAEQCHLLEKRNLDLRKDLRESVEKCAKASADADKYRALADDLKMQILHTTVMAAGSSKLENRLQEQVTQLKNRVRELEAQKKEITKDRNTESRILDRVCEKHSMLEQDLRKEATRHEIEESKYTAMLEDFRAVTERETHHIVADLQQRNQQVANLQKSLKTLEGELVKLRQQLLDTTEQLADGREREQALTLEKELLHQQLEDMTAAYRRDLAEARAEAAGVALTQARLLETQGMLRDVEQELSELKATVSDTLSREAALVGRIMVARHETAEAVSAKVSAERMYQHQHIATLDLQLKLDKNMEGAVAKATREAVVQAVNELTKPGGNLTNTRSLNAVIGRNNPPGQRVGTDAGSAGLLGRMDKNRGASSHAVKARVIQNAEAARIKAEIVAPPLIDLGPDDAGGDDVQDPLSKVMNRERTAAKQMLAQKLLQKTFDVLESQGVRAAHAGRRIATTNNNTDSAANTRRSSFSGSAVGFDQESRDFPGEEDPHNFAPALVQENLLLGRPITSNDVRVRTNTVPYRAPESPGKVFALAPSPSSKKAATEISRTPMRSSLPSSRKDSHKDTVRGGDGAVRRGSQALQPEDAARRFKEMTQTRQANVEVSPLTRHRNSEAADRVWDVAGGSISRPMFRGGSV